jgi:hypothetical protein
MTLARSVHLRNVVSRNSRYQRTVHDPIQELQVPPKWILYQKQPETLRIHEVILNSGKPIPDPYLDRMIAQKIDNGSWKVIYKEQLGRRARLDRQVVEPGVVPYPNAALEMWKESTRDKENERPAT